MKINDDQVRLDRWLWYCRFFKSRTVAARQVKKNMFRVNGKRVSKASYLIKLGDVVIFIEKNEVRRVKVVAAGHRRGASSEAKSLYEDLETCVRHATI